MCFSQMPTMCIPLRTKMLLQPKKNDNKIRFKKNKKKPRGQSAVHGGNPEEGVIIYLKELRVE